MKNYNKKKLSLEKIEITKLRNIQNIRGGSNDELEEFGENNTISFRRECPKID
ncbi:hypothetical protein [Aquimarina pacifica]|uniref:hypothetical protein n=1 Tax=Aquimarina pacifica TaxID=1296415 RepID=UPI0004BB4083|nr:hypothetical protein [Aquimarina pacifica]